MRREASLERLDITQAKHRGAVTWIVDGVSHVCQAFL